MKRETITCDRCEKDMTDESAPVTALNITVEGFNYAKDDICRGKDLCRSCISHVRSAIVHALATPPAAC